MFEPLKKDIKVFKNIGFDIETYGNKNKFLLGSLFFDEDKTFLFHDKNELISFVKTNKELFEDSIIWAHNLSFDFFGSFNDEIKNFQMINRGSDLIYAKTFMNDDGFNLFRPKRSQQLIFYDTMSFFAGSLKKIGILLNNYKYEKPVNLGKYPDSDSEMKYLEQYNIQDSRIAKMFADFLQSNFNGLGCQIKATIASTAMDLYKRKFLKDKYRMPDMKQIEELHNGYYGGRTEIFKRGYNNERINIYDVNSLYPSVMRDYLYPDPNTQRRVNNMSIVQIKDFEGMTYVEMESNGDNVPILPQRYDSKLVFANGLIKGYYTHFEIRKALEYGYKLKKIKNGYFYRKNVDLFSGYVDSLYALRSKYKEEESPMEIVPKILLNSLYGKFATRLDNKTEIKHSSMMTHDEAIESQKIGKSEYYRVVKKYTDFNKPNFINPVISAYVTSYARLRLYEKMVDILDDVFYIDTDSIFTTKALNNNKLLGELKLEAVASEYYLVKPKFYALKIDKSYKCKIKGCSNFNQHFSSFEELLNSKRYSYTKFTKFREALIRGFDFNEKIEVEKYLDLEDNKRDWLGKKFNAKEFQNSKALII